MERGQVANGACIFGRVCNKILYISVTIILWFPNTPAIQ